MKYKTGSVAQTKKIAALFAQKLLDSKSDKGALIVIFKGDLGAGKTTFIQGLMRGFGVRKKIVSPTFTLLRSYAIKGDRFGVAHHFDCYRMGNEQEMRDLGFKKIAKDSKNIILIEWPERVGKILPRKKISVMLKYGEAINERIIELK